MLTQNVFACSEGHYLTKKTKGSCVQLQPMRKSLQGSAIKKTNRHGQPPKESREQEPKHYWVIRGPCLKMFICVAIQNCLTRNLSTASFFKPLGLQCKKNCRRPIFSSNIFNIFIIGICLLGRLCYAHWICLQNGTSSKLSSQDLFVFYKNHAGFGSTSAPTSKSSLTEYWLPKTSTGKFFFNFCLSRTSTLRQTSQLAHRIAHRAKRSHLRPFFVSLHGCTGQLWADFFAIKVRSFGHFARVAK